MLELNETQNFVSLHEVIPTVIWHVLAVSVVVAGLSFFFGVEKISLTAKDGKLQLQRARYFSVKEAYTLPIGEVQGMDLHISTQSTGRGGKISLYHLGVQHQGEVKWLGKRFKSMLSLDRFSRQFNAHLRENRGAPYEDTFYAVELFSAITGGVASFLAVMLLVVMAITGRLSLRADIRTKQFTFERPGIVQSFKKEGKISEISHFLLRTAPPGKTEGLFVYFNDGSHFPLMYASWADKNNPYYQQVRQKTERFATRFKIQVLEE